jgi:hypothetical protein
MKINQKVQNKMKVSKDALESDISKASVAIVVQAASDYFCTMQKEESNRAEIYRKRDTAIAVIAAEKDMMLEYIKLRFGERSKLYDQYYKLIDDALVSKDTEVVGKALEGIMATYKENPFLGFEDFKKIAQDKSSTIEI